MTTSQASSNRTVPLLHVFEQAGGWHWGITVQRPVGGGFKVIAFSDTTFLEEEAARADGRRALASIEVFEHL